MDWQGWGGMGEGSSIWLPHTGEKHLMDPNTSILGDELTILNLVETKWLLRHFSPLSPQKMSSLSLREVGRIFQELQRHRFCLRQFMIPADHFHPPVLSTYLKKTIKKKKAHNFLKKYLPLGPSNSTVRQGACLAHSEPLFNLQHSVWFPEPTTTTIPECRVRRKPGHNQV